MPCDTVGGGGCAHVASFPIRAAELLRENKRMLDKAIRDLDRERGGLQSQEKKLIVEIKKMAKQNQMVRTRKPALKPCTLEYQGAE